jgi:hypothetical protein
MINPLSGLEGRREASHGCLTRHSLPGHGRFRAELSLAPTATSVAMRSRGKDLDAGMISASAMVVLDAACDHGARRFMRRGLRLPGGVEAVGGAHNLLKLWRHTVTQPAATPSTAERSPGEVPEATANAVDQLPGPSPELPERPGTLSGMAASPFRSLSLSTRLRYVVLAAKPLIWRPALSVGCADSAASHRGAR